MEEVPSINSLRYAWGFTPIILALRKLRQEAVTSQRPAWVTEEKSTAKRNTIEISIKSR